MAANVDRITGYKAPEVDKNFSKIGNVTLDFTQYPGEDFYTDGEIEDEILSIVRDYSKVEYKKEMERRKSWPITYHLSNQRENVVDWVPLTRDQKVLEVGSGCGAITGVLSRKAGSVTCVDLSKKRCTINAYRNSECENITIKVGNFQDIEPHLDRDYDVIFLIGVFEYGQLYIGGDQPFHDFLKLLRGHIKAEGRIIIAIENKYGLKYFAGCREDHLGTFFSGIEGYEHEKSVRTFSRQELCQLFQESGIEEYQFYYPYPDYKFMTTLFSDKRLPERGECTNNMRNMDRDRMLLFDEGKAFDSMQEDGSFCWFSNSFLVVLGPGYPIIYERFSNDRDEKYCIRTEIAEAPAASSDSQSPLVIRKYPTTGEAMRHVAAMEETCKSLTAAYEASGLQICPCKKIEEPMCVEFPFVKGETLTALLDHCVETRDEKRFLELFKKYVSYIEAGQNGAISNLDFAFGNFLVDGDSWTLIDYEWITEEKLSAKNLAFRGLYVYLLEGRSRNQFNYEPVFELLGVSEEDAQDFRKEEQAFQSMVNGRQLAFNELVAMTNQQSYNPVAALQYYKEKRLHLGVQVYEDMGQGFSEKNSYHITSGFVTQELMEVDVYVKPELTGIRLDPGHHTCIIGFQEILWNGESLMTAEPKRFCEFMRHIVTNGKKTDTGIVFYLDDPWFCISKQWLSAIVCKNRPLEEQENHLYIRASFHSLDPGIAMDLKKTLDGPGKRLVKKLLKKK